ncbi:MAG: hypothetical protein KAV87_55610 [Desulfobacteraceae bacterium]|nr:hypothetical protein [Desulfobacteraceae bacterium]
MSDFLVSLCSRHSGKDLLNLIKKPYGKRAPEGQFFDYPWGSIAVLEERLACNNNIITNDTATFAWVGDLVVDLSEGFVESFINRLTHIQECGNNDNLSLQTDEVFEELNGAFAIVFANTIGLCIVTDPVSFTMVYVGKNRNNEAVSFGTHPDLVASISDKSLHIDMVSVGEFLNSGTPIFPNTMYRNVKELNPGRLYNIDLRGDKADIKDFIYWSPPKELSQGYDQNKLAKELENILLSVVRDRCNAQKVAVLLSGGLDSRLIMAAVPETVNCIGLTFCDHTNRETRTAKRVANSYNRDWFPVVRDKEFLGNSVVDTVKLTGCEFDWVDAHSIGLVEDIAKFNLSAILGGAEFDGYFKGYCATDWFCEKRMRGLLPDRYKRKAYDYVNNVTNFWKQNFNKSIVKGIHLRKKRNYEENADLSRGSIAEWLFFNPFSQDGTIAYWSAERRVLPVRLVAMDRRVLDFTFKCPIEHKLGNKIFLMAAKNIYGAGSRIPNANDGVRPGSGHWSRLMQRAVRKLQDTTANVLKTLGEKPRVHHSWHDYQKCWQESSKFAELIQEYGANLGEFDGELFVTRGWDLLAEKELHWKDGFRLLQLAVWRGIILDYKP